MGDILLDNASMVTSSSLSQETDLARANEVGEVRLGSVNNNFGNKLVRSVTKPNRPEVPGAGSIGDFGN